MAQPWADQNLENSVVAGFILWRYLGAIKGRTVIVNKSNKTSCWKKKHIYLSAICKTDFWLIISVLAHYLKTKPIWQAIRQRCMLDSLLWQSFGARLYHSERKPQGSRWVGYDCVSTAKCNLGLESSGVLAITTSLASENHRIGGGGIWQSALSFWSRSEITVRTYWNIQT